MHILYFNLCLIKIVIAPKATKLQIYNTPTRIHLNHLNEMLQELKEVEILNTKFQIDYRNMLDNFILILQVLLC